MEFTLLGIIKALVIFYIGVVLFLFIAAVIIDKKNLALLANGKVRMKKTPWNVTLSRWILIAIFIYLMSYWVHYTTEVLPDTIMAVLLFYAGMCFFLFITAIFSWIFK